MRGYSRGDWKQAGTSDCDAIVCVREISTEQGRPGAASTLHGACRALYPDSAEMDESSVVDASRQKHPAELNAVDDTKHRRRLRSRLNQPGQEQA